MKLHVLPIICHLELAELERCKKEAEAEAERKRIEEEEQNKKKIEEEKMIRAQLEAIRLEEERRQQEIENNKKNQLAELREEIMGECISIEKAYLTRTVLQSADRNLSVTAEHNSRKQELSKYRSGLKDTDEESSAIRLKKTLTDLEDIDAYYSKAKTLVKNIVEVSEETEKEFLKFESNYVRAKQARDHFEISRFQEEV